MSLKEKINTLGMIEGLPFDEIKKALGEPVEERELNASIYGNGMIERTWSEGFFRASMTFDPSGKCVNTYIPRLNSNVTLGIEKKAASFGSFHGKTYEEIRSVFGNPSFENKVDGRTVRRWDDKKLWNEGSIRLFFDDEGTCVEEHYSYSTSQTQKTTILGIIALVAVAIFIVVACITSTHTNGGNKLSDSYGHDTADAIVIAEKEVRDHLKSPSTAEFCRYSDYTIDCTDNTWSVAGWVDAQNSFGATLRNTFTVRFEFTGQDRYTVINCVIN